MAQFRVISFLAAALALNGCASASKGPEFALYGAYFPSWIASTLIGIISTVIIRLVLIRTGLDDVMPLRVLVYLLLAICIGLATSLFVFGR
ncbi:YtcA family lipoprotein [Martelella endophytica]|uniref:Uncharacterized protein YtcA n=1 Tax=Martelella endophytica TaxID=1486262 RepID=A0A0D5LM13_MAREN|nr:YtcA family lipoprotein [Martelella endophytica]AJY44975.1 hypothetical protein TM49_03585 [Martelella endophytica]